MIGLRSTVPCASTVMRSGETFATVCSSKPRPRDPAKFARTSPVPPTSLALPFSRASETSPYRSPCPAKVASTLVPLGSSSATRSSLPRWTTMSGGPTSFTSRAVKCASTRWMPRSMPSTTSPVRPPPATASCPATPPVTTVRLPDAFTPDAVSDAIWMTVCPPRGSRIAPLPSNGPSNDPPLAVQLNPCAVGTSCARTLLSFADGRGLARTRSIFGRLIGPSRRSLTGPYCRCRPLPSKKKLPSRRRYPFPASVSAGARNRALVKRKMPSAVRSRSVSIYGNPPDRLARKALSRRRTHTCPFPTTRMPRPFGPGTTFSTVFRSTMPRPGIR